MHPALILGGLALLLFSKKGTTTSGTSPQLLAAQTALQKAQAQIAQQAALAKAQAAAQNKPSAGGSGGGSGLGAATPTGSSALSNQLSQFLANLTGGNKAPGTEQTVPVSTDLGAIDSVATPGDYSFVPSDAQQTLDYIDAEAALSEQNVTPDYTDGSGLTDLISSTSGTDTSPTDYQIPTVDPFASDPSLGDSGSDNTSDYVDGSSIYNGDGTFIDPYMDDATGYDGWDYGGD